MKKYIRKALEALNLEWNNPDGHKCDTIKDIEGFVSDQESQKQEMLNIIERCKSNIETLENNISLANQIINQAIIEKTLAENPRAISAHIVN